MFWSKLGRNWWGKSSHDSKSTRASLQPIDFKSWLRAKPHGNRIRIVNRIRWITNAMHIRGFSACVLSIFSLNFKFEFQVWISSVNFKFESRVGISNLNFKFELQVWRSSLISSLIFWFEFQFLFSIWIFRFEFQVWVSSFNFKLEFQVRVPSLNFKFEFANWISSLTVKFDFQVWRPILSFKFECRVFKNPLFSVRRRQGVICFVVWQFSHEHPSLDENDWERSCRFVSHCF